MAAPGSALPSEEAPGRAERCRPQGAEAAVAMATGPAANRAPLPVT